MSERNVNHNHNELGRQHSEMSSLSSFSHWDTLSSLAESPPEAALQTAQVHNVHRPIISASYQPALSSDSPVFGEHPPLAMYAPSSVAAADGGAFSPHVMNGVANDHHMDSAGGGDMYSRHSRLSRDGRPRHGHIAHNDSRSQPSSNLIIHQHLLTLDMRSYRKLEDAIVQVKLFLENVRHLAIERGLYMEGEDMVGGDGIRTLPSLFVTIVTGEGGNGSSGTILRAVLQKIFRNRDIHFIDHGDGGESFQVDALSGIQDAHEDQPPSKISNDETTASWNHHPSPNNERRNSLDDNNEPALASRHQAMMVMQAELLDQRSFSRSPNIQHTPAHHQHLPQVPQMEASPPMMIPQAHMPYPQDHGAGMLYNPFDSIAHTLLTRNLSGDSSGSGSSNTYYNALSGAPTATALGRVDRSGRRRTRLPTAARHSPILPTLSRNRRDPGLLAHSGNSSVAAVLLGATTSFSSTECSSPVTVTHNRGGNIGYPAGHHHRQQPPSLPESSPEEAALRAAMLAQARSSNNESNNVNEPSNPNPPANPSTVARSAAQRQQQRPSRRNSNDRDPEIRQAISESQADHIAHTRRQVTHDIQFRRALELATNESTRYIHRGSSGDPQDVQQQPQQEFPPGEESRECPEEQDEEELIRVASRQSILDERNRKLEAEKKYALELEFALKQSEHLILIKQEEEARFKESEEETLQDVIVKSRAEEDEALRNEEELLQHALAKSLSEDANVDEDELFMEVIRNSLNGSEHMMNGGSDGGEDPEDMIEQVLKLSLEEKEQIGDEEEEPKKAMEWSVLESTCDNDVSSQVTILGPLVHRRT